MMALLRTVLAFVVFLALCGWLHVQGVTVSIEEEGVLYQPVTLSGSERTVNLVPGNSYRFSCESVEGGFGSSSDAVWYHEDGVPVSTTTPMNSDVSRVYADNDDDEQTLVLQMFNESMIGTYSCRELGRTFRKFALHVGTGNPTAIAGVLNQALDVGLKTQRFSFFCFVSGNPQPTRTQWLFNGQTLSMDKGFVVDQNELLFPITITRELAGNYSCSVTNEAGSASSNFTVSVNVPPSASISPSETQVVQDGSSISFTCRDNEGVPPPMLSWKHEGNKISQDDRVQIVTISTLTLSPVLSSDAGTYECEADNTAAGFDRQSVELQVQGTRPSTVQPPQTNQQTQQENADSDITTQQHLPVCTCPTPKSSVVVDNLAIIISGIVVGLVVLVIMVALALVMLVVCVMKRQHVHAAGENKEGDSTKPVLELDPEYVDMKTAEEVVYDEIPADGVKTNFVLSVHNRHIKLGSM